MIAGSVFSVMQIHDRLAYYAGLRNVLDAAVRQRETLPAGVQERIAEFGRLEVEQRSAPTDEGSLRLVTLADQLAAELAGDG